MKNMTAHGPEISNCQCVVALGTEHEIELFRRKSRDMKCQ